jgi:hypothetical protein
LLSYKALDKTFRELIFQSNWKSWVFCITVQPYNIRIRLSSFCKTISIGFSCRYYWTFLVVGSNWNNSFFKCWLISFWGISFKLNVLVLYGWF